MNQPNQPSPALSATTSRRRFLSALCGAAALAPFASEVAFAAPRAKSPYRNLMVLIELKGGNDGLNTLVPYADPAYYALRPKLGIARDQVIQLSDKVGLHPALAPLQPLWTDRQLAVLQGVGYPAPNLSHFRSIEIWDTATASNVYAPEGWLTRAFASAHPPSSFAADGVIIGSNDLGPLGGGGARTVALANTETFLRQAKLVVPESAAGNKALRHIVKVEDDILQAAANLDTRYAFTTEFPNSAFGNAMRVAAQVIANPAGVAAVRVTLGGFDTHGNQAGTHARLLGELARGIAALQSALVELKRWDDTLILTYAEFGRRPRENLSLGTDHGTASVHFALGGRVAGGLYGEQPSLTRLSGDGNLAYALDFRSVYATALERWWGLPSSTALSGRHAPLDFLPVA
jgi:uncharacterized protein (DUF1501 family)